MKITKKKELFAKFSCREKLFPMNKRQNERTAFGQKRQNDKSYTEWNNYYKMQIQIRGDRGDWCRNKALALLGG